MEIIVSRRKEIILDNAGYKYHKGFRHITGEYVYRCSKTISCHCKATIQIIADGSTKRNHWPHIDVPDIYALEKYRMEQEMLNLAKNSTNYKEIFKSVCERNPQIGQLLSFSSMRYKMASERKHHIPISLLSLQELPNILETYSIINDYYKGIFNFENELGIIFSHNSLLQALSNTKTMLIIPNYIVVPANCGASEIISIHAYEGDKRGFLAALILLKGNSHQLYDVMWNKIVELAPELINSIELLTSNFDENIITSSRQKFVNAKINSCYTFYFQALSEQWEYLRLRFDLFELFNMAANVAWIPSELFPDAERILQASCDSLATENIEIQNIMVFWRNILLPACNKISFFNCDNGINNYIECYEKYSRIYFHLRPSLCTFIDKVQLLLDKNITRQRNNNEKIRIPRSISAKCRIISTNQRKLLNNEITLKNFLTSHRIQTAEMIHLITPMTDYKYDARIVQKRPLLLDDLVRREDNNLNIDRRNRLHTARDLPAFGMADLLSNVIRNDVQNDDENNDTEPENIEDENNIGPNPWMCRVCLTEQASRIFIPCMHFCTCQTCADLLRTPRCPLCRTTYERIAVVY